LRHAHAVEMAHEGVPLVVIQRQLQHANLGITSVYCRASTAARSSAPSTDGHHRQSPPPPDCRSGVSRNRQRVDRGSGRPDATPPGGDLRGAPLTQVADLQSRSCGHGAQAPFVAASAGAGSVARSELESAPRFGTGVHLCVVRPRPTGRAAVVRGSCGLGCEEITRAVPALRGEGGRS
jgi:hypothetical protein